MIPILYTADENRFVTNGVGRLSDCTRFVVTEERNGIYEAEFDIPITGAHFDDIRLGMIVAATHDDKHDIQPFVIYRRSVPDLNGIVTFNAHHISYKLGGVTVMPFSAGSCAAALQGITANAVNYNPFLFWTDKTTTATFESTVPRNARNMLGGEENSILDVFGGGDYEFDKFTVKLHAHRGVDSDVEIRYAKNLTDLNETIDESGSYNAIVPFWTDSEGNMVMLPEKILVYSGLEPKMAYLTDENLIIIRDENEEPIEVPYYDTIAQPMDLSDAFEEAPTVSELRNAARTRFENSEAWLPAENLTVDFVQLWQTEEFKEYSALQRVSLCDTVSVYYPQLGIAKVKQRVVKTVYNTLLDRYDEIELGQVQTTLGQQIREGILKEVPTTSMMDAAIQYATEMIRGGLGGYVVMTPGANGYPQEILIMDTPDKNTARNVWRFNRGGLGHSSNGYNGPYSDIALTADGRINASIITTGILNANIIRAGVLQDVNGNTSFDLSTGLLVINKGSINLGSGNFTVNDSGAMHAESGTIGGFTIGADYLRYQDTYNYYEMRPEYIVYGEYKNSSRRDATKIHGGDVVFGRYGADWGTFTTKGAIWDDGDLLFLSHNGGGLNVQQIQIGATTVYIWPSTTFENNLKVNGTKSRIVNTKNYDKRLLYCYETPTPMFGDIGEATIDEDGFACVDVDDIFSETVASRVEYQVFLQAEGEGTCYIAEKHPNYFVIKGTPNLKVAWELKAKQRDYENIRLEQSDNGLEEYSSESDPTNDIDSYINEMEALLYDY